MSENEELNEHEESEETLEDFWCMGKIDSSTDEEYKEYCSECERFHECFQISYGESYTSHINTEKKEESREYIEAFVEGLSERLNVDFQFSKPRKIVRIGKLSFGMTIPQILGQIYKRSSKVLTYWNNESKMLLFFGENSFTSESNRETLKTLFLKGYAIFRSVVFVGKLNVIIIPQQFKQYFSVDRVVNPEFDCDSNVVFINSNLTESESLKVETEKQQKSYFIHSSISKKDSKRSSFEGSEEYKQQREHERGLS